LVRTPGSHCQGGWSTADLAAVDWRKSTRTDSHATEIRDNAIILYILHQGDTEMAGSGKADKGRKQQKKKPQHTLKEKRKLKEEKKNKASAGLG
jgi:hypothetical protein